MDKKLNFLIYIILFFILVCLNLINCMKLNSNIKCMIHNKRYGFDYLFSNKTNRHARNVYVHQLGHINNLREAIWILVRKDKSKLISTNNEPNEMSEYYMKNLKTQEFLCASDNYQQIFMARYRYSKSKKRYLYTTDRDHNEINSSCEWEFEKIKSKLIDKDIENDEYVIRNVGEKESLFADGLAKKHSYFKRSYRNAFLWPPKTKINMASLDQFIWFVDCMPTQINKRPSY